MEEDNKKIWRPLHKFFYALFSVTQSFLLGFSWSFGNIADRKKKNTSKTLEQNTIIPLICQFGLFIHTCVPKNAIVFKDTIFYLLW